MNNLYWIKNKEGKRVKFELNWAQKELFDDPHPNKIVLKARQLGITTYCCLDSLDHVLWEEDQQCGIIAHTRDDASNIFKDKLKYAFDSLHPELRPYFRISGDSAAELAFSHASLIRVGTSLRSSTLQILHISEFGKICAKYPEKATEVVSGALQTVHIGQKITIESTAEGKEGYFHDMWQIAWKTFTTTKEFGPLDYKPFFFPWWKEAEYTIGVECDIPNNLKEYFAKLFLEGIKLNDPQKWWYTKKYETQKELMCREYPSTPEEAFSASQEGYWYAAYIKELYDTKHIQNISYDRALPVHTAWDLGQSDHMAIWFFQVNRQDEVNVIDFWQKTNCPLNQVDQMLTAKGYAYGTHIWPHDANARDRAGITFVQQIRDFNRTGIVLQPHNILQGISLVKTTLSKCWFDQTKCHEGLVCLENYKKKWNSTFGGWSSEPEHDKHSHACFIGETMIETKEGSKRIDQIKVGDLIVTPNGYKKCLNVFSYKSPKYLRKITTPNHTFTCTDNHKIFSSKGLVYADALSYNDILFTEKDYIECQMITGFHGKEKNLGFRDYFSSVKIVKLSISMDIDINGMEVTTEKLFEMCLLSRLFRDHYGLIITGKLKQDVIFIISTKTQETILLKISKRSNLKITIDCILHRKKGILRGEQLKKQCFMPRFGMALKKALNGIANMVKKHSQKESNSKNPVSFALKDISHIGIIRNSAQKNVKPDIDTNQESTITQENVKFAQKNSSAINTSSNEPVVRIAMLSSHPTQKVYDIEVEDDHCYYANGILVSNSDAFRYLCAGLDFIRRAGSDSGDTWKALRNYFQ